MAVDPSTGAAPVSVLAVEDDPSVAQAIALVLGGTPCSLCLASGVDEALTKIAQRSDAFDVVITDHNTPELSGRDLVRRLRDKDFNGRIVVLSAYVSSDDEMEYRSLGVNAFLEKPFGVAALRQAVGV